jgi:hypothetical protein
MPSPMGQGSYSAPGTYGQPAADPGRPRDGYGQPVGQPGGQPGGPQGGQPAWAESEPQAPVRKSRKGLIIALIVAAVVLVVGVGGYVGWSLTNRGSAFTVGACVKPDGGDAVVTDCSTSGAFKITNIVDTENGCTDPNQPSLVLTERVGGGHKWACLAPAAS